ncbi:Argininosuccinate lyase, chloroplastic [Vitis vinifera]|uniref:argininosuccinate lyase n=1 Tax=Vitis vinifera TaxID=29760 RepID=A0A438G013_VITVI|nr:Argininosuccinate lyase, chloroplastic [Vitis vinifera]
MEALSSLINRAVRGGFLSSCRIRGREGVGIQVSHLLFADDTLVFCEDSQEQLAFLSWLLPWFEATSGLCINLNKSEILPVGRVENAKLLAAELGCKVGSLPSTYLGLPLGASHKSVMVWDGVEERMWKRLALWKRQFISKGPSCANGVGVLRLKEIPIGSLLLVRSMGLKEEGGVLAGLGRAMGWGFGRKSVREAFPSLFDLAVSKYAWVVDYWDSMGEEGGWTPRFLRPFNDWEVEEVERFLSSIQGKRLNADVEDRMVWKETKNEIFTVKSLYNSLVYSCAVPFPWNIIWSRYVPTKVSFFAWEASWEKVLTQDRLKRRDWILVNRCSLCCAEEETINHILVHCSKAKVALVTLAMKNENLIVPGYTHLQRAQPILLQHLLLAYVEQLDRDAGRLLDCRQRLNFCPLGACALAGTGLPIDRFMTSHDLGFNAPMRNREDKDKMVWTTSKSGAFSVKLLYSILEPGGSSLFPCGSIWRANVPPKVAFFAWEASWGKILTLEQLQRRGNIGSMQRLKRSVTLALRDFLVQAMLWEWLSGSDGVVSSVYRKATDCYNSLGSLYILEKLQISPPSWLPIYLRSREANQWTDFLPKRGAIMLKPLRRHYVFIDFFFSPLVRHNILIDLSYLVSSSSSQLWLALKVGLAKPAKLPPSSSSLPHHLPFQTFLSSSSSPSFSNLPLQFRIAIFLCSLKEGIAAILYASISVICFCILHNLDFLNNWSHFIISIDAVSDRDFVLEFLSANSITAIHLSRLGEEWVLWASEEFGFLTPSDSVSTGSSIMPQKKNPDPMELVRGKSARVVGDLVTLLVLCKGLPHAYNRDLQEDKEPTFDSTKTIIGMLEVCAEFAQNITFNREKIKKALPAGHLDATTLADYLVKKEDKADYHLQKSV